MSNNCLNRFGDTSCRIKFQLKFYFELLNIVKEKELVSVDDMWNIINNNILKHDNNKSVNHKKFWIKQLKNFDLITIESDMISLTTLGKNFLNLFDDKELQIANFDIVATTWFFLMINSDKKLSSKFRLFVKKIIDIDTELNDSYFINFILAKDYYGDTTELRYNNLTEEELNQIIDYGSIQLVAKCRKKIKVDESLPKLISNLNNNKKILLQLDNDKKLVETIKQSYRLKYKIKSPIISDTDLLNYIHNKKEMLINDVLYLTNYKTVVKDYQDINKRWFVESKLIIVNNNKKYVNEKYRKLYKKLLTIKFDNNLINFKEFITKQKINIINNFLPYSNKDLLEMLELANKKEWNLLKNKFELEDIRNSTIFEYIVNMVFFTSLNFDLVDIKKYCNTLLDDNLKPYCHAPRGNPDGLVKIDNNYMTIESTIIESLENLIKNEKYSIQRHSINEFRKTEFNTIIKNVKSYPNLINPCIIFVMLDDLNEKIIHNFSILESSFYYEDPSIKIKTIVLSSKNLIMLYKFNKIKSLNKMLNYLPINNIDFKDLLSYYNKLINNI